MASETSFSRKPNSKYLQFPEHQKREIPYPQGPYTTGCADLLVGRDVDGSLIRLFYPTDDADIKAQPRQFWTHWNLGEQYYEGMATHILKCSYFTCGLLTILRFIFAKLAYYLWRNVMVPALWEAPLMSTKKGPIPVIIFSHGLTANRSLYSSICNDMASNGFLVAVVEHRDQSAGATFTLNSVGMKRWMKFKEVQDPENEVVLRIKQVKIRAEECSRALDIIQKLNQGVPVKNLMRSSFDLESLKGKLDLTKPCIAGQSFGGGTVLETLGQDKRFQYGISLDPWMICLGTQAEALSKKIQKPILFILMEKFQDEKNMAYLKLFQNERNSFYTIKNALHQHQVDSGILVAKEPVFIQKFIDVYSPVFHAKVPLTINNALIMKFIWQCLGQESQKTKELESFLKSEEQHIAKDIRGCAKSMLGWASYDKPLSHYIK